MSTPLTLERPTSAVGTHRELPWARTAGRIGIAARGVVYLVLAYLAFDIARHGSAPAQASSTGALEALRALRASTRGAAVLIVLAVGLACYAVWRLVDALAATNGDGKRLASLGVALIYGVLSWRAVELVVGHPTNGGASSNPEPWVARVMRWSGGTTAVGGHRPQSRHRVPHRPLALPRARRGHRHRRIRAGGCRLRRRRRPTDLPATVSVVALTAYFLIDLPEVKRMWLSLIARSRRERVGLLTDEVFDRVSGFMLGNLMTSVVSAGGQIAR